MNIRRNCKLLFVLAAIALMSQSIYAQNIAHPVVAPGSVQPGYVRPHSWIVSSGGVTPFVSFVHGPGQAACNPTTGCYYFPADIVKAYTTTFMANANGGAGMTVGIVDAFYNPQTEADLGTFNSFFGLSACTIGNGCLKIVNQTGGSPSAGFNQGWADETNLDVQWVHAIAPNAKILLVTADSNSFANMDIAETWAATHSDVVSNSWGGNENVSQLSDTTYSSSTVPILFSSGDTGAVAEYPCMSPFVTCVGGTNLTETLTQYRVLEKAWGSDGSGGGGGGGCSLFQAAPLFQSGYSTGVCVAKRGAPDIAALADPYSGAIVYLGTNAGGTAGFYIFGGTSLACPIMAAVVANIDTARVAAGKAKLGANLAQLLYQAAVSPYYPANYRFYDVKAGSTGFAAVPGWDRATGLGLTLNPSITNYFVTIVP